jgi:FAD/FMN-containing dehydrogenase
VTTFPNDVSPQVAKYSHAYNRRLSYKHADIVFSTNGQVACSVSCASQAGVKGVVRSGGRYYAANGVGGDGSLVIDLKNLNRIQVTASNQKAVFGRRIRIGYHALEEMAHGSPRNMPS